MLSDHQARLRAQREFVRPLVIEAGAGTGKTATLVGRILAWSLGPGWTQAAARLRQRPRPASSGADGRDDGERVAADVLGRVVAMTFTEAAAAEMAERVAAGLAEVEGGRRPVGFTAPEAGAESLEPAAVRRRAAALLGAADQLQVRTIHSFCRKLLAEHPFAAGLHPHFTVDADGAVLREVVEETVASALLAGYGDPGDADCLTLAGRGYGPMEIADAVFALAAAGRTSADLAAEPLAPERRAELGERLWQATNRLLTLLEVRRVAGSRARNAAALFAGLGRLRRHLRGAAGRRSRRSDTVGIADLQAWLDECLPANLGDHLRLWARGGTASQAEKERLASVRDQLMPLADEMRRLREHVARLDPELLACGRRVLAPLLDRVHGEIRSRGALGFSALLREARRMVTGHPAVLTRIRRRIDQLLVDEFQDTDPWQCELIRRLALEGPAAERPGLFVVGDPKQSIYGWRNADLAAYESFVAAVTAAGGELLMLDENFRSRPAILDEVERVVSPVMRRQPGLQPEFRPLRASEPGRKEASRRADGRRAGAEDHARSAPVEHWISWRPDPGDPGVPIAGTARETSELEAHALAADLVELRRAGVAWGEVGILLRSLTDVEAYLAALREAGIPFVVSRDRQYYRRREIIDAAALVRAVLAPEDELALLTFLRSVAVGVPDAALLPLWTAGLPRLLAELAEPDPDPNPEKLAAVRDLGARTAAALPADVPGIDRVRGWEHNLARAAECLGELRRSFEHASVDVFVDRLRSSTLFEASEAARYLGVFRQANLERFFAELAAALERDVGDRHRLLRRLRRRIAEEAEAEEARPDGAGDAVQVTTIHKAKGLEFRHVYLLQMHKEAGRRSLLSLEIDDHEGRPEYRIFGAATLGFDRLEARRDEVARAELVRTLYVAMTRASERLVLVGRRPLDGRGAPLARAATHMDLVLRRRGDAPSPTDLVALWRGETGEQRRGDVLWRLPGRTTEPPAALAGDAAPAALPSPAEVRARRDRLRRDREAAARRMERPFRQVASKLGGELPAMGTEGAEAPAEERSTVLVPAPETVPESERRRAMAAGSAVHRLLETFDLTADPGAELARQRRRLPELVRSFTVEDAADDDAAAALERAERLLDRFAAGRLLERFRAIAERIVARELPVLLPPADGEAVGFVAGVVDLVYRDPASGEVVVADFKTDLLPSPAAAAEHARRYAAQAEVYVRALRDALELAERPRFELWYLDADHVEVVR